MIIFLFLILKTSLNLLNYLLLLISSLLLFSNVFIFLKMLFISFKIFIKSSEKDIYDKLKTIVEKNGWKILFGETTTADDFIANIREV